MGKLEGDDDAEGMSFGFGALVVVALVAALAGGILGTVITRSVGEPDAIASVSPSPSPKPPVEVLTVGETATTARGNEVGVEGFAASVHLPNVPKGQTFSTATVKYCAGGNEITVAIGVVARLFSVQLDNGGEATVAPGVPGDDLLDRSEEIIGRGRCVKGDLFFLHALEAKPVAVVFKGVSTIRWELAS